jgi:hypothetical protein
MFAPRLCAPAGRNNGQACWKRWIVVEQRWTLGCSSREQFAGGRWRWCWQTVVPSTSRRYGVYGPCESVAVQLSRLSCARQLCRPCTRHLHACHIANNGCTCVAPPISPQSLATASVYASSSLISLPYLKRCNRFYPLGTSSNTKTETDGATVSFEFLNPCKLHNRGSHILQPLFRQVRAGDVFDV